MAARAWVLTDLRSGDFLVGERFRASVRALRHGFIAHDRKNLIVKDRRYAMIEAPYQRNEIVDLVAKGEVGETTLVAERGYEKPSLGQRLWYTVGGIFE